MSNYALKDRTVHQLEVAKEKVIEQGKVVGRRIDQEAHKKPWYFVGIAAFFSVVFGFFLGRKTK